MEVDLNLEVDWRELIESLCLMIGKMGCWRYL